MTLAGGEVSGFDLSRETFIGSYGSYGKPAVLVSGQSLNSTTYGDNSCGALQTVLELQPGESRELLVLVGIGQADKQGRRILEEFGTPAAADAELEKLKAHWHGLLDSLHVQTPDAHFDSMVNVWNAYNCLITYAWSALGIVRLQRPPQRARFP